MSPLLPFGAPIGISQTKADLRYFTIDQTEVQTVINGAPIFNGGLDLTDIEYRRISRNELQISTATPADDNLTVTYNVRDLYLRCSAGGGINAVTYFQVYGTAAYSTPISIQNKAGGADPGVGVNMPDGLMIKNDIITTDKFDTNYIRFQAYDGSDWQTAAELIDGRLDLQRTGSAIPATNSTYSLGSTSLRYLKLWADDIESTNMPTVGGTSLSDTFVDVAGDTMTGDLDLDTHQLRAKDILASNRQLTPWMYNGIGVPPLKLAVTTSNADSNYYYRDITSVTNYTIQSGDYLVYSIYLADDEVAGGVDFTFTDASFMRSTDTADQNGLKSHPGTVISDYCNNSWYQRKFDLTEVVGKEIQYYDIVVRGSTSTGAKAAYFQNIMITDVNGNVRKVIYLGGEVITSAQHLALNSSFTSMAYSLDRHQYDNGNRGDTTDGRAPMMFGTGSAVTMYSTLGITNLGDYGRGSAGGNFRGVGDGPSGAADAFAEFQLSDISGGAPGNIWAFKHGKTNAFQLSYYNSSAWDYGVFSIQADADVNCNTGATGSTPTDLGAQYAVVNDVASDVGFLMRAAASQSANIHEWQNSAGTPLTYIEADGEIVIDQDSKSIKFGAGQDMDIMYDGTDGYLRTDLVAASDLNVDCGTDKTIELIETVYDDIYMPLAGAKVPASNAPTWATFDTNLNSYTFSLNDYVDLATAEILHRYKEGTNIDIHVHFITNGANDGTERKVKYQVFYSWGDEGEVMPAEANANAEETIVASEADKTHHYLDIAAVTGTNYKIGSLLKVRLKRIAGTGTEPANDPFVEMVGVHYQVNTMGSRQKLVK